jgi:hypothetical protein
MFSKAKGMGMKKPAWSGWRMVLGLWLRLCCCQTVGPYSSHSISIVIIYCIIKISTNNKNPLLVIYKKSLNS